MQVQVDIGFDDLLRIVKTLPKNQLNKFKRALENAEPQVEQIPDLESFLLNAPTFSDKQIENISQTRKEFNEWRKI